MQISNNTNKKQLMNRLTKNKWLRRALTSLAALLLFFLLIPLPRPLFPDDYSTAVLDAHGEILRVFLNRRQQWQLPPRPDAPLPHKLKTAVLEFEDRYFYRHPGVNPLSLLRALRQNMAQHKIVSGASTLTMQVARLMRPKTRSYGNKILEILQALKIEILYSKEEIFRLYLNHAPYGGNVVGFRAAARRYFRKPADRLTWSEAATLAVLPNAPGLISPQSNPRLLKEKRNRLLHRLFTAGHIDQPTLELALREEIPRRSFPFAMHAAHLARRLKMAHPRQPLLRTTIDLGLQTVLEDIARKRAKWLHSLGIPHFAALVVENRSGSVRAYLGSPDFKRFKVDGVMAPRSSGSILKPFLYALSVDEGLILPPTLISDVPSFYGAFSPSNADERYRGIVTAHQALVQSLNVPAVRLLNKYGLQGFYEFLKAAGLRTLFRPADAYGLPLIIGGAEVTLWDMAKLYCGLANGGNFAPIHALAGEKAAGRQNSRPLVSPGAAYLVLQILNDVKRPGSAYYWRDFENQWPLAWKTGTSYGQRDAWAVGVNPQWTIAVWAGDFEGRGNANIAGSRCAGPLLFDIFEALPKDVRQRWFSEPTKELRSVRLCKETGFAAGPSCPHVVEAKAPLNAKPLTLCPYHRQIFVSLDEKEQVCSLCWKAGDHKAVSRLVFPPEVSQILRQTGKPQAALPPHRASCPAMAEGHPLRIIYPHNETHIWLPRDLDGKLQRLNARIAHRQPGQTVFWYVDTHYLGSTNGQYSKALTLPKGWHRLLVIDQNGRRDEVKFFVNLREKNN